MTKRSQHSQWRKKRWPQSREALENHPKRSRVLKEISPVTARILLELKSAKITDSWERSFAESLQRTGRKGYNLTPKQIGVALRILGRGPDPDTRPTRTGQAPSARRDDVPVVREPDQGT